MTIQITDRGVQSVGDFGGRLLGGSLVALADSFPDARLHLDPLGSLPGAFGAVLTSALEGAWFSACLVGALGLARR